MKLKEFLQQAQSANFWQQNKMLIFSADDYPFFFFNTLFKHASKNNLLPKPFRATPYQQSTTQTKKEFSFSTHLQAHLSQSFLGEYSYYWFGNLSTLPTSEQEKTLNWLNTYSGTHYCSFFITTQQESFFKGTKIINVSGLIDKHTFHQLYLFFNQNQQQKNQKQVLADMLFEEQRDLTLDKACMALEYFNVTSVKDKNACQDYFERIFESHTSLNALAAAFFAKKETTFFAHLQHLEPLYPPIFWISFWSEQIWRAYNVVNALENNQQFIAQKMGMRLPSLFVKMWWKSFSLHELRACYTFLYEMDCALKQGSLFCLLDTFYFNHFLGTFKKEENNVLTL